MGIRVEVAGFRSSMANKTMDAADRFIELDQMTDRFRKESTSEDEDEFRERL
jgi:uncharacterized LabA/DUF88 family protein